MTEIQEHTDREVKYAEKIAKLLRLAENAGTQEESDTFTEKAQQLLITYAISEELLQAARGLDVERDVIVEDRIHYTGIYRAALYDIGKAIAVTNGCKIMISKENWVRPDHPATTVLYLVGFKKDVERVKLLDTSIQLQACVALRRWWESENSRSYDWPSHLSNSAKFKMKREFLFGFATGIQTKLKLATKAGVAEGEKLAEARVGSGELVLRNRAVRVQEWYDETYGTSLRKVRTSYASGGYNARNAGREAGSVANVGQTGIGRNVRGSIGG
jgi:hypothetical protein